MNEQTPVTKRDLVEQNFEKVFAKGFAADKSQALTVQTDLPPRPSFGIDEKEFDAAKIMSGIRTFPEWLRGSLSDCWDIIQQAKAWSRYDARTRSWICFHPTLVARNTYLVRSDKGTESIGQTSLLVGAIIDAFVKLEEPMTYTWAGEGEDRTCTAIGQPLGKKSVLAYTTPPLRRITPKRSPLWTSDPDRQLAYYARRAWARLYAPAAMLGVYDVDELEGDIVDHRGGGTKDVTAAADELQRRLAEAAAANGDQPFEGFNGPEGVEAGLAMPGDATETAASELAAAEPSQDAPQPAKRASARPKAKAEKAGPPPKTVKQYAAHVAGWLPQCNNEQEVEERWRVEMKLRNICGVTAEAKQEIRATFVDQRIADLRATAGNGR